MTTANNNKKLVPISHFLTNTTIYLNKLNIHNYLYLCYNEKKINNYQNFRNILN